MLVCCHAQHFPSISHWNFTFMWPCIVTNFFVIKPTRCTNFPNILRYETVHVSGSSSAHYQEFIHCTLSNGICHTGLKTAFERYQDGTADAVPCSKAVWRIPLLSVQRINSWWWAEELSETCRVSWQNKFVKLVHLVGFIIKKFPTATFLYSISDCRSLLKYLLENECWVEFYVFLHRSL